MAVEGEQRRSGLSFSHRVLFLICAVVITIPVLYKSRPDREDPARAAFSALSSPRGFVRISGDVNHPGIYPITVNNMAISAIKMATPFSGSAAGLSKAVSAVRLESGMALNFTVRKDGTVLITKSMMNVHERLAMGIPLDINAMSEADFDKVPGVGPKMARKIIEYRHKNGGYMEVRDLNYIDGIGENKYKQLCKYF